MEIYTIQSSTPVNVGSLTTTGVPKRTTLTLVQDDNPFGSPFDIAKLHLSEDIDTTMGIFLTPSAPRFVLESDPNLLWAIVLDSRDFVQVVFEF